MPGEYGLQGIMGQKVWRTEWEAMRLEEYIKSADKSTKKALEKV